MIHRNAQPVTITVPTGLLKAADKIARKEGRSRSELFREALRAFFWKKRWEAIRAYGVAKAKQMGIKTEEDIERVIDELRD